MIRTGQKRNIWVLILGVSGLSALGWFVNSFPPTNSMHLFMFFLTVLLVCFLLSLYGFNNVRRALLLSTGLTVYLVLRYLDLRHPLYLVLLIACLISLELHFQKR